MNVNQSLILASTGWNTLSFDIDMNIVVDCLNKKMFQSVFIERLVQSFRKSAHLIFVTTLDYKVSQVFVPGCLLYNMSCHSI